LRAPATGGWLVARTLQYAEKVHNTVIPREARNLSSFHAQEKKERFLASLGMTKSLGAFSGTYLACGISVWQKNK
jgi:hypothetical protein